MNEQDVELLESYLDDELTGRALEALRLRLSTEPQLAAGIDELRAQREVRQQFFAACQPDEASVNRLIQSVRRETTRDVVWGERNRKLRRASGLAACLAFGFIAGRTLHNNAACRRRLWPRILVPQSPAMCNSPALCNPMSIQIGTSRSPATIDFVSTGRQSFLARTTTAAAFDFSIRNPGVLANVGQTDPFPGDRIYIVNGSGRLVQQFDSHEQYMKFVTEKLAAATQPASIAP